MKTSKSGGVDAKFGPSGQVLDSPGATQFASVTAYELAEILAALGLKGDMAGFATLAADLSRLAGRVERKNQKRTEMPWTKKYVHSVYHGKLIPSAEFAAAVGKLAQLADGTPAGVAGAAWVKVLADPNRVPEGVLIPAGATVVKCARPGCPVWFVRVHPRQRYHDADCRRQR